MSMLLALTVMAAVQASPEDASRPRVPICTAQEGVLDRYYGIRQSDGRLLWYPHLADRGAMFSASREPTAAQRDWYKSRRPLTAEGVTYVYAEDRQLADDWAFRRYNRPHTPVDGVPAMVPMGQEDEELWILLEPVGCRFAVWTRDPGSG